ncbi:hypothetical protein T4B_7117 [Trichinella pseudospiralis]|uniref:Uncharacterized protein n=2 Tax=Trichinella pseudospiralis TaxID=6337 RepID=A0A0V1EXW8_TRIPS|nr:hypothetical protein T4E_8136 [Trichinella pseudospiralis]KRY78624.1 hypothetical protein T4A_10054 [Trichinella pseudospiralis]KRY92961.1 hypothetical protein T4D_1199 [Trichinella pseudospiralis]KRZ32898.1 hypothetical protein T4B_7117 [Trichinella pseudospiralis]KRZ46070.1 hypothetical protein T4C_829 [Trichinella pseudospiralis]
MKGGGSFHARAFRSLMQFCSLSSHQKSNNTIFELPVKNPFVLSYRRLFLGLVVPMSCSVTICPKYNKTIFMENG